MHRAVTGADRGDLDVEDVALTAAEVRVGTLTSERAGVVVGDDDRVVAEQLGRLDLLREEAGILGLARIADRPALQHEDRLLAGLERQGRRVRDRPRSPGQPYPPKTVGPFSVPYSSVIGIVQPNSPAS